MTAKPNSPVTLLYHGAYLTHTRANHPESKERLLYILDALRRDGLLDRLPLIEPAPALLEEIARAHDLSFIRSVEDACRRNASSLDNDTYIVPESYHAALLAAGGALRGLREIMMGNTEKAFVLCRPPGHHAERGKAMGFCLFNNIAIAACAAREEFGLKRVAIIDWDVHHGNGTQNIFADDPSVLFVSIHESDTYPGTGHVWETGRGAGLGYTVNIPLPAGSGDADYALAFKTIIVPVLNAFEPELVMVSAGQDAYHKDPLGNMKLTWRGFLHINKVLTDIAKRWCHGRMIYCLEGGYHYEGQAEIIAYLLRALSGLSPLAPLELPPAPASFDTKKILAEVSAMQGRFWPLKM